MVEPGQCVLDVASGRGGTALLLAGEYGVDVDGVDLDTANVALANGRAEAGGQGGRVRFRAGDAERLPFGDESFDAVVCECAFCTFPDKPTAAGELARVLRPGGRVGITDVTIDPGRLPEELTSLQAWVACIADARPLDGYADLLRAAGLRARYTQRQDDAMRRMLDQIEARLALVRITARERAEALGSDLADAPRVLAVAREALAREGIEVRLGRASFVEPGRVEVNGHSIAAPRCVIATGSRPAVPPIPGLETVPYLTNETVFDLPAQPKSLAVLGGGAIGCELAQAFARLGATVTLVEAADRLLPDEEPEASQVIEAVFGREHIDVRTGTRLEKARPQIGRLDAADPVRQLLHGG